MNEYKSALINALRQASPQSSGNSGVSFFGSPDRLGSSLSIKDNYGKANDPSVLGMVANTPYTVEYGNQLSLKTGVGAGEKATAVQNALRQGSSPSFESDMGPSAWDSMSSSEKAAWYRENPTMSKVTQTIQDLWGMTSLGTLQNAMDPEGVYTQQAIARGFDPAEGWKATNDFGQSITSGGQAPAPAPTPAPEPPKIETFDAGEGAIYYGIRNADGSIIVTDKSGTPSGQVYGGQQSGYTSGGSGTYSVGVGIGGPNQITATLPRGSYN